MPSTIDYSSMLPLSIPAMASRRKFFPSNGSTFSETGNRQIRIEIGHPSALLDPTHSYLEFSLQNTDGNSFGPDIGGSNIFFESVRVEQAGKLLSYTQASNRLHSAILSPVQTSSEGVASESCTEARRAYNTNVAASIAPAAAGGLGNQYDAGSVHNNPAYHAAGATLRYSMVITSGLFSQDKLIPLPLVDQQSPITLVLDMAPSAIVGAWAGNPAAGALVVRECAYVAHLVEVGRDVIDQFKMVQRDMGGQLAISGQDYEYFTASVGAATGGQAALSCPARKRSIKSFLWCSQSNDFANTAGPIIPAAAFRLSFAGSLNVESWQFQVGPMLYPPGEPVQCWGNTLGVGNEFNRGQCALELSKAVGTMASTNPTGTLNTITYATDQVGLASGENGIGGATHVPTGGQTIGVCPFGLSVDSFSRDVIESGVDTQTLAQETRLLLNWAAGINSGAEAQVVHIWALFDQHYYFNMDGSVTYSN